MNDKHIKYDQETRNRPQNHDAILYMPPCDVLQRFENSNVMNARQSNQMKHICHNGTHPQSFDYQQNTESVKIDVESRKKREEYINHHEEEETARISGGKTETDV